MLHVSSAAELTAALRAAEPNSLISLAIGEYGGVFVIEKPLVLRGQKRQTVLWRQAAPVVYVRAPNVRLENLLIERTVQAGVMVVHDAECLPTGEKSMQLDDNTLINLGELLPGAPVSLPLRLTVRARTELSVSGLHGAKIEPTILSGRGTHTLLLTLDGQALQKGEVLLGEITVREGDHTRYLWLTGTVLDQSPPERLLCLALKKHRLYPPYSGMMLSAAHFAALAVGTLPEGDYCFVQRDPSGALFLFMPSDPPLPVKLNGTPIPRGVRRLLHDHDMLNIGEVAIQVTQAAEPPSIEVPTSLHFERFSDRFPEPVPLTLQTLKVGWKGEIIPIVPYIGVSPDGQFRLPPNRTHTWLISLNKEALNLPNADYIVSGGLLVAGANQVYGVDVHLSVQRPEVALHTEILDLGQVEAGWLTERSLEFSIANLGRGAWSGEVYATVPWLSVLSPIPISGEAWSETFVQVGLSLRWEAAHEADMLPSGIHEIADALIIDGGGVFPDVPIAARIEVLPPRGHLRLLTEEVRFDEVERNMDLPSAFIEVRNEGAADWHGTLRPERGWVQIIDASGGELSGEISAPTLSVPYGQTARIRLELLDIPDAIPLDTPVPLDAIHIKSDSRSAPFAAAVPVSMILVERPPFLTARPVYFPPFVRGEPPSEATLRVYNTGPSVWRGTVQRHAAWLAVPNSVFECAVGSAIDIPISIHERQMNSIPLGVSHHEAALSLSGVREPVFVAVQLDLRDAPHKLYLETPLLNFGKVNPLYAEPSVESVRVLNAGVETWQGEVTLNAAWLSLETARRSFELSIPPMSAAEFKVLINTTAVDLPSGVCVQPNALSLEGGGQRLEISAQLSLVEAAPRLSITPLQITLTSLKAAKLKLTNNGGREWTLTLNSAPWLALSLSELTLEPNETQSIEVRWLPEQLSTAWQDPRGLVVVGNGREWAVAVEVSEAAIKSAKRAKTAPLTPPSEPTAPNPSETPTAPSTPPTAEPPLSSANG
ncbi:MAG: hypothetical protein DYG88_15545 [Chloroflexi bacterium CFX4]|nr:hypothetical protein [Chloroflexi bacterium CFX4]MDL1924172.1 hypothetical protein [Chloroflexi bacterium CFX3]